MKGSLNLSGYVASAVLSSITNLIVSFGVARTGTVLEFGAVSFVLLFYSVLVSLSASTLGSLFSIREELRNPGVPSCKPLGALLLLSLPLVPVFALLAWLFGGDIAASAITMALLLPLVLLHDLLRHMCFAHSTPWQAVWLDLAWLVVFIGAAFLLQLRGHELLLGWALAAALVSLGALFFWRIGLQWHASLTWIRTEAPHLRMLAADGLLNSAGSHLAVLLASIQLGLTGLAAVRGAQVVVGPVAILHSALLAALAPRVASRLGKSSVRARWFASKVSYTVMGGVLLLAAVAGFIPDHIGEQLLGQTWALSEPLIALLLLAMSAHVAASAAQTVLRSSDAARHLLVKSRLLSSLLILAACFAGAFVGGATGFCVALIVGRFLALGIWEWHVAYAARRKLFPDVQ